MTVWMPKKQWTLGSLVIQRSLVVCWIMLRFYISNHLAPASPMIFFWFVMGRKCSLFKIQEIQPSRYPYVVIYFRNSLDLQEDCFFSTSIEGTPFWSRLIILEIHLDLFWVRVSSCGKLEIKYSNLLLWVQGRFTPQSRWACSPKM